MIYHYQTPTIYFCPANPSPFYYYPQVYMPFQIENKVFEDTGNNQKL